MQPGSGSTSVGLSESKTFLVWLTQPLRSQGGQKNLLSGRTGTIPAANPSAPGTAALRPLFLLLPLRFGTQGAALTPSQGRFSTDANPCGWSCEWPLPGLSPCCEISVAPAPCGHLGNREILTSISGKRPSPAPSPAQRCKT